LHASARGDKEWQSKFIAKLFFSRLGTIVLTEFADRKNRRVHLLHSGRSE
jgi:hypothetical protein